MCGIAGSVNYTLPYQTIKENMLHRGPDEQAGFSCDNVDFFHLRLAILDREGGKQPMHLNNRYTIIFKGQIYNHTEIRRQFHLQTRTSSDTETLLLLYERLGAACLQYLDGMFVFALYDRQEKQLFIARDRAGKKPLYYYKDAGKLVFASELNCIKSMLPLQANAANFYHYTRLGSFYGSLTPYHNVTELDAGSYLLINCAEFTVTEKRWWNIHEYYTQPHPDTLEQSLEKVDTLLHQAVKRRVESSDLEVGFFLSGGIDSGLITAIGTHYKNQLKTFTVSFSGAYDEAPLAKQVADKYCTQHTQIEISLDNLRQDIERIIANYGEPFFDSSAIPSYYVSREAKKHLTVIINGDGADELFGGYRRYVPFARYDFFKENTWLKASATTLKKLLPLANDKKSRYNYLYRLVSLASQSGLNVYLSAGADILEGYEQYIHSPGFDYMEPIRRHFNTIVQSPLSGLQKIMNLDFDITLFGTLLVKMDIATMAHSLEGRSPFLCKELLEYAPGMSDTHKINGTTTKYLLRKLAKKYLPPKLVSQPKRGFEVPLKNWVNTELREVIADYVGAPNTFSQQFVQKEFTRKLLDKKITIPEEKRAKILWMLFCMEVWYKKVYNPV